MDLTRDFIEKIEEMTKPHIVMDDYGAEYSDKELMRLVKEISIAFNVNTLTGIVDYLTSSVDQDHFFPSNTIVNVRTENEVCVFTNLNADKHRDNIIVANRTPHDIIFNRFVDRERFNIMLQALFIRDEQREIVLDVISQIKLDNSTELKDNGISQSVTAMVGVDYMARIEVPNPVVLRPYRTFNEVEQPASNFVLRVNENGDVGLWEADGGAWKNEAMKNIKAFLVEKLGNDGFTILA